MKRFSTILTALLCSLPILLSAQIPQEVEPPEVPSSKDELVEVGNPDDLAANQATYRSSDQLKTLFQNKRSYGGYFALDFQYLEFENQSMVMAGARGAWVIGHSFSLGLGGVGIIPNTEIPGRLEGEDAMVLGGWGGLILEPILFPKSPIHLTLPIMLGAGSLVYEEADDFWNGYGHTNHEYGSTYDVFFIAQAQAQLEFSMLSFMRLGVGAGYRFTHDLQLEGTTSDVLDGWQGSVSLKFGKF